MIDRVPAPVVYVDANPFIYAIEGENALAMLIKDLFARMRKQARSAVASELTLAEVLPKASNVHRRSYFDLMVWSGTFDLRPITREILVETASYRKAVATVQPDGRETLPKLPDAIHAVTAIKTGRTRFLSADAGIRRPTEVRLIEANGEGVAALIGELA